MLKRPIPAAFLLCLALGAAACPEDQPPTCIGTPGCLGPWQVFAGKVGAGQACTTPAGDLHVRYEGPSSDALMATWSKLIPPSLGVELARPWGANQAYREAIYKNPKDKKHLIVQIVQSGSGPVRTVRLTWDQERLREANGEVR